MQRQILDTNVLIRFLTGEPPIMAAKARRLMEQANNGKVLLTLLPVVVAETIYTLESFYATTRKEAAAQLLLFVQSGGIEAIESLRVVDALTRCRDYNVSFVDGYLAASAVALESAVASFDRDFDKFKDVRRIEPQG